jgi:hypothetical protein
MGGVMNKVKSIIMMVGAIVIFSGCATIKEKFPLDVDQTAQAFFDHLQRSDNQGAYNLLAKGLSQRISFDQFDQFMQTIRGQWGRLISDDTELLPFHRRTGEQNFIPLNAASQQIKRYVFDVKFENAEMNFDLTLAPQGDRYKIIWFSIWGSSIYMTPKVREKIEKLFSNPDNAGQ